ncbi:MAG: OsmC family protein [Steroidobacteraceae bacterium]
MDATTLRAVQAPLKQQYRDNPDTARIVARAEVALDPSQLAVLLPGDTLRIAGLHQATGGTGIHACSADMLLEALAACAGVTLMAVATAMACKLTGGRIVAEGLWDARGTLGVDKITPVGIQNITLTFELEGDLDEAIRQRLLQLTERYCVILATLRHPPSLSIAIARSTQP